MHICFYKQPCNVVIIHATTTTTITLKNGKVGQNKLSNLLMILLLINRRVRFKPRSKSDQRSHSFYRKERYAELSASQVSGSNGRDRIYVFILFLIIIFNNKSHIKLLACEGQTLCQIMSVSLEIYRCLAPHNHSVSV